MNSENNILYLLLNLSDVKWSDKYVALSNCSTYYTLKNIKK